MLIKSKKIGTEGFTLIEMLVAMTIFVIFVGILLNSYTDIVRSQRYANEYRQMYSESRHIFETLSAEFREGMVDYAREGEPLIGKREGIYLVSKDALKKTHIKYENGKLSICKGMIVANQPLSAIGDCEFKNLNSDSVVVKDFGIYVSPAVDPYDPKYVFNDFNQFHPKVTIYAKFYQNLGENRNYEVDLQTSFSSRIYNRVYAL